jgi:hypothetical protein
MFVSCANVVWCVGWCLIACSCFTDVRYERQQESEEDEFGNHQEQDQGHLVVRGKPSNLIHASFLSYTICIFYPIMQLFLLLLLLIAIVGDLAPQVTRYHLVG